MWTYHVFQGAKPHTVLHLFLFLLQLVYELFCLLLNISLKKHNYSESFKKKDQDTGFIKN